MAWIFAAVVLCLLVFVPAFRKAGLIIGAIVVGLGIVVWLISSIADERQRHTETQQTTSAQSSAPTPPKTIPINEIRFTDLHWQFNQQRQLGGVSFRMYNDSKTKTLDSYKYRLTIDDCRTSDKESSTSCATVHDQSALVYLTIPPMQARDTNISVPKEGYMVGPTILGKPRVNLEIIEAIPSYGP
jgi:hypothetical protein